MTAKPLLRVVEPEAVDITLAMRAEIKRRDWSAVHIAGDRRAPVNLPDRPARGWRG